jgi:hypothetical protein
MHLPPLDVAVYPVVTMSHGRHGGRSVQQSPTTSSLSHPSNALSRHSVTAPDFSSIQKVISKTFRSSRIAVQQVERIQGRFYQVYLARLADGSALVLKYPPNQSTRTLRHEKYGLETERRTLDVLRQYTELPVPQVLKYDSHGASFGSPFLLTSYIQGRRLCELTPHLSTEERNAIERTLGLYVRTLATLSSAQFGMIHCVSAKKGYNSWQKAFIALLELALRDCEEMLVTVPYDSIRFHIGRHGHCLDEVTEPRLVALDACDPQNVLVYEQTKQIIGLVGFSNVIWGDALMSGGITDGTDAFFEGFGERPLQSAGVRARHLM